MEYNTESFIQFALDAKVLSFGSFALKSGRISPYFFNSGLFKTGRQIQQLGAFYAQLIVDNFRWGQDYDVIFGPAYKGIPLAIATTVALSSNHGLDVPYAFNRKEHKQHGEGGVVVGASLVGKKVLLVDDVITAGTAIRASHELIQAQQGCLSHGVIALDRQEISGARELSAIEQVQRDYGVSVRSLASLNSLIDFVRIRQLDGKLMEHDLELIKAYQKTYGCMA